MKTAWVIHHSEPSPSYNSSEMIKAFEKKNVAARLIDFNKLNISSDNNMMYDSQSIAAPDFGVITNQTQSVHGSPSATKEKKDVLLKLESLQGTTFVNSPIAHADCANKNIVYQKLRAAGVPYPKTEFVSTTANDDTLALMIERIGFPLVVKNPVSFESSGVSLCHNYDDVKAEIQELESKAIFRIGSMILQEYIRSPNTAMFCVRVVGDQVFVRMFLYSPYDTSAFKSFVSLGRQQLPCIAPPPIAEAAKSAVHALGLHTARLDMFLTDNDARVIDVNALGSLLPTDQTHNIHIADLIVDLALQKSLENDRSY
jgi:glutathione synthase/RimK-type ligase-like ATP-grasp enzyme